MNWATHLIMRLEIISTFLLQGKLREKEQFLLWFSSDSLIAVLDASLQPLFFQILQDQEQSVSFVQYLFLTTKYRVLSLSIILSYNLERQILFPI